MPIDAYNRVLHNLYNSANFGDVLANCRFYGLLTKALVEAKQSAEAERDRALAQSRSSITERNEAVRQLQAQEVDI